MESRETLLVRTQHTATEENDAATWVNSVYKLAKRTEGCQAIYRALLESCGQSTFFLIPSSSTEFRRLATPHSTATGRYRLYRVRKISLSKLSGIWRLAGSLLAKSCKGDQEGKSFPFVALANDVVLPKDGLQTMIKPVHRLRGHVGAVNAVKFNRTGQYCLSAGADRTIRLWNPRKELLIKSYVGHGYEIADVAVARDNAKLASCGGDKTIFLWDVSSGQVIRRFGGQQGSRSGAHSGRVNCVCFGGMDGDAVLITGSYDTSIRFWDVRARSIDPVQVLETAAKDSISSVAAMDVASEVLSASIDGGLRIHDIRSGRITLDQIGSPLVASAFSHDGNCMVAASLDSTVRLMDKATGEILAMYRGHVNTKYKTDCELSYDDSLVCCGSEDGRVVVWDLVENEFGPIMTTKAHESVVSSISSHPSEIAWLSASHDGSILYWTPKA